MVCVHDRLFVAEHCCLFVRFRGTQIVSALSVVRAAHASTYCAFRCMDGLPWLHRAMSRPWSRIACSLPSGGRITTTSALADKISTCALHLSTHKCCVMKCWGVQESSTHDSVALQPPRAGVDDACLSHHCQRCAPSCLCHHSDRT